MDRISEVLSFLRGEDHHISGDYISSRLGISRTAVWKYINQLEKLGYKIGKLKGKGYRLLKTPDRSYPWEVRRFLNEGIIGCKLVYKESVDSTNIFAFKFALAGEPEGSVVLAEAQKGGKGRLNRKWYSPAGKNLYLSVILRPRVQPSRVYPITFLSSLAVHDTIETVAGIPSTLKWPNDVLIEGKKICGTLLELSTETDMVNFVIVGIGLNVNTERPDFDEEIQEKATSLFLTTKKHFERARVCGILLSNLDRYYRIFCHEGEEAICRLWEERSGIKGKFLTVNQMGQVFEGYAAGVDRDGGLLLDMNGERRKIIAGDVSV